MSLEIFASLFVNDIDDISFSFFTQDPIKSLHFSTSNPICHSFDPEAKDGHDLLIGLNSGDGRCFFFFGYDMIYGGSYRKKLF